MGLNLEEEKEEKEKKMEKEEGPLNGAVIVAEKNQRKEEKVEVKEQRDIIINFY